MSIKSKIIKELDKSPRTLKELKNKIGNDKKVVRAVDELFHAKKISCKQGVYANAQEKLDKSHACVLVKLGRNFGFAQPEDGTPDIFVPGKFLMGAMPGDRIMVSVFEKPRVEGSVEGEVVAILEENNRFVGTIDRVEGRLCLIPDRCHNTPIIIKKSADGGARVGDKAAIEIIERATSHQAHRAGVSMRFGSADSAKQCAKAMLYGAGIVKQFPLKVKAQAKNLNTETLDAAEVAKRRDLRTWNIFTIDAASTKDIDDAISITRTETGYQLGVHIADVSYYVTPNTALDKEASARGTSVYYADSVVPMLPRQLSNGICSLNEKVDRFAFSCLMQLDESGRVTDYSFEKTIICSCVKGVYAEINAIYDGTADDAIVQKYAHVAHDLPLMRELYQKLAKQRAARGAMDIQSNEAKLVCDEDGVCVDVVKRTRGISEKMIEEFMLLANSAAANFGEKSGAPFVYRTHEKPDPERIETLKQTLRATGVDLQSSAEEPNVLELAKILKDTKDTPLQRFVHTNVLRSMAKAKYAPQPVGHFSLALHDYTHFTSPIRRYPDLMVHRILSDICTGADKATLQERYTDFVVAGAVSSSASEVAAMHIERDVEDCYKAEYMRQFIGDTFDAVISSVTSFGVYVELPNTVEGLVHASALSDRPLTLVEGVALKDMAGGKAWRLGDALRVQLTGVDVSQGNVDFVLCTE